MPESIGELVLCAEGQRLYDEYNKMFDDENNSEDDMLDAWDAYYEHRMICDECQYK